MVNLVCSVILLVVAGIVYYIVHIGPNFVTSQVKLIMIVAVCDLINNTCLITNGDGNIHGISMIYIFESCSEIILTILLWRIALRYWTASLIFDSSLIGADTDIGNIQKTKAQTAGHRIDQPAELRPGRKLKRLPISE